MKSKDVALRALVQHEDVFSEIVRLLITKKDFQIHPGELLERDETVCIWADKKGLRSQSRDIVRYWNRDGKTKAIIGLENQTAIEHSMPLRVCAYDGGDYKSQLACQTLKQKEACGGEPECKRIDFVPVMTIVVYFGLDCPWKTQRCLYEVMDIPEVLKPFVTNYKLNVINVAWLKPSVIARLKSDFRLVADMCRQLRLRQSYVPDREAIIQHPYEFALVWYAFTQDPRIFEFFSSDMEQEVRMCEFLDSVEAKGFRDGKELGEKTGEKNGRKFERDEIKLVASYLREKGKSEELPEIIDNRRRFKRYLRLAMDAI